MLDSFCSLLAVEVFSVLRNVARANMFAVKCLVAIPYVQDKETR